MRVHAVACGYVLFFAFRLELSRGELACLFLTMGAVTAAECMNTAVEKLSDFTEKRYNPRIRVVKDLAAGAVLLSAIAAAFVGVAVLWRPELWTSIKELCASPVSLALLAASVLAAVLFVVLGPDGKGRASKGR